MLIGFTEFILAITTVIIRFNKNLVLTNILLGSVRTVLVSVIANIIDNTIKTVFYNNLINLSLTFSLIYPNRLCFWIVIGDSVVLTKVITYSVLILTIPYATFLYVK